MTARLLHDQLPEDAARRSASAWQAALASFIKGACVLIGLLAGASEYSHTDVVACTGIPGANWQCSWVS